jgi:TolA-binding protein
MMRSRSSRVSDGDYARSPNELPRRVAGWFATGVTAVMLGAPALVHAQAAGSATVGASASPAAVTAAPPATDARTTPRTAPAAADGQADGSLPWAGTAPTAAAPPVFLDTTDRRIRDERPEPTAAEVAELSELESEVSRFTKIGGSYRDTLIALLRREYLRKRYAQDEGFDRQIRAEEALEDQARLSAIEIFERFIAKYPSDPRYTPDAMFRLGELYFERDAIQQQEELEAFMAAREGVAIDAENAADEPQKDFNATITLYRRLVREFPEYERSDGVYYLIGYCLNEMGETNEARLAWLNLVCANKFKYTGEAPVADVKEDPNAERVKAHPALGLDPEAPTATNFEDPYADCTPAVADSKFFAETWLRIGEYHFDYDFSEHGLSRSISAYRHVLKLPADRNYNLALYKVAWAYYRASRYPEAMQHFWQLVQWSDDERKRTGRGSELREEAIQYLGIGFAYDDWNENQLPDPQEGLPTGLDRVQDPKLLPQDRAWTSEVYQRLGYIYFDEAKYNEAVTAWELALKRWPNDPQAPEIQNMIGRAYTRANVPEQAIAARGKLGNYAEGSAWWEANKDHPVEQRRAEELAEEALIGTAINHHQRAQQLRRSCVEEQDLELCAQAQAEYGLAALAYRGYIQRYPNNPQAYELQYNLADALYWSQSYEDAAKEYAAVRDSNLDDKYLSTSARLVVESIKQIVDQQAKTGQLQIRTEPPVPEGSPARITPVAMPALLQRLAGARELYLARVDDAHDTEGVRDSYFYNNTLLLYLYGYWDFARDRFLITYDRHCSGKNANDTGQVAWFNLRNMAVAMGRSDEVRQLGKDLEVRKCTFAPEGTVVAAVDCWRRPHEPALPRCGRHLHSCRKFEG